jgi:serine/threonine-protein kinase RsbW
MWGSGAFANMSENHTYILESTLQSVRRAGALAERFAAEAGFQGVEVANIGLAVHEAVTNAVLHGSGNDPTRNVELIFALGPSALEVAVRDQGQGFDPSRIPDPRSPENLLKPAGRGIFVMRALMDEVRFRNLQPGTEVSLLKRVRSLAAQPKKKMT